MVIARFINDINTVEVTTTELSSPVKVSANMIIRDHNQLLNRDLTDQHPISAITGLEQALQRADTFIFEQGIASDEWVIEHNLNKYPSVTVVDSADNTVIGYVTYDNENTITIKFNAAFKGKAYLN